LHSEYASCVLTYGLWNRLQNCIGYSLTIYSITYLQPALDFIALRSGNLLRSDAY